jgi:serine/threonine protein kinase
MQGSLPTSDDELRDLAAGAPLLVDAARGENTGIRLLRCLGAGGMATVFLAELDPSARGDSVAATAPRALAVKLMQLSIERQLARMNMDPLSLFAREAVALRRVMQRSPPTEFVVGFYGSGQASISLRGGSPRRVPWLAIEYVDGGAAGGTLSERIGRALNGIDPVRAQKLVRGILEGVRALHEEGIIHRDLKPDNVLVTGPVDDETPKLADCGIARVTGMATALPAMTRAYGGPEQRLSLPEVANPLIGPWTDVHALAAVVFSILGGEAWCLGDTDARWFEGHRRSLRTAQRVHPGFSASARLMGNLDAVLQRGASSALPPQAFAGEGAALYRDRARALVPSLLSGEARYATADAFAADLLPLLDEAADRWKADAARRNLATTAFRSTQMVDEAPTRADRAFIEETPPHASLRPIVGTEGIRPGGAVFQPDGRVLARVGSRLVYFVDETPHKVGIPAEAQPLVASARWLVRGPRSGFALVGPSGVLLLRGGAFARMPLPFPAAGGDLAPIEAAIGDGHVFGIVTGETEESGGPELWLSSDGAAWTSPRTLPLGGEARAAAYGPYGFVVVGAKGKRARALSIGHDDQITVFTREVNDKPPLSLALCGAERAAWGAGEGYVVRFDRAVAAREDVEVPGTPVAFGLDPVGIPWLVTERGVLRRHVEGASAAWRLYYERDAAKPALAAIGFTPAGARVLDAAGGFVKLVPRDIGMWSGPVSTSAFLAGEARGAGERRNGKGD